MRLKDLMKANEWDKARTLVRFIADLVNCRVVDVSSIVALYKVFANVTLEEDIPQVRSDWFVYAILSSLPWVSLTRGFPQYFEWLLSATRGIEVFSEVG